MADNSGWASPSSSSADARQDHTSDQLNDVAAAGRQDTGGSAGAQVPSDDHRDTSAEPGTHSGEHARSAGDPDPEGTAAAVIPGASGAPSASRPGRGPERAGAFEGAGTSSSNDQGRRISDRPHVPGSVPAGSPGPADLIPPGDSTASVGPGQAEAHDRAAGPGSETPPLNWAKQQPPRADWATPGWGGQAPGGEQHQPPGWNGGPHWGGQQGPPQGQWVQNWGRPPAAKPGVIPLRPLGVGEILDGAVSTIRAHWRTVLGVSLAVAVITQAISTVLNWWMLDGIDSDMNALKSNPNPSLQDVMDVFGGVFAALGVTEVITLLGTLVVTAMLTIVVSRAVLGRPVTTGDTWRDAKPQLPKLLGLTLLIPLIAAATMFVGMIPGLALLLAGAKGIGSALLVIGALISGVLAVWLLVQFSLAPPTLMLEKQGVVKALKRSTKLVQGSWWRICGILILTAIITLIVTSIVQLPFGLLSIVAGGDSVGTFLSGDAAGSNGLASLIVNGIGAALGMTIGFPISAGVTALLYVDQRIRREALDLDLARAAGLPGYADANPADHRGN